MVRGKDKVLYQAFSADDAQAVIPGNVGTTLGGYGWSLEVQEIGIVLFLSARKTILRPAPIHESCSC